MFSNYGVPEVFVEWALWGRRPADSHSGVLSCSDGNLNARDFAGIIDRYQLGRPGSFRLFFASVEGDDRRKTIYVRWDRVDRSAVRATGHEPAQPYLSWLTRSC